MDIVWRKNCVVEGNNWWWKWFSCWIITSLLRYWLQILGHPWKAQKIILVVMFYFVVSIFWSAPYIALSVAILSLNCVSLFCTRSPGLTYHCYSLNLKCDRLTVHVTSIIYAVWLSYGPHTCAPRVCPPRVCSYVRALGSPATLIKATGMLAK
jgi:hypothetical protein